MANSVDMHSPLLCSTSFLSTDGDYTQFGHYTFVPLVDDRTHHLKTSFSFPVNVQALPAYVKTGITIFYKILF